MGVVEVEVAVDQVANRLVGDGRHGGDQLTSRVGSDVGIDQNYVVLIHDNNGVAADVDFAGPGGEVDAGTDLLEDVGFGFQPVSRSAFGACVIGVGS